jgi:hypothetical protein
MTQPLDEFGQPKGDWGFKRVPSADPALPDEFVPDDWIEDEGDDDGDAQAQRDNAAPDDSVRRAALERMGPPGLPF